MLALYGYNVSYKNRRIKKRGLIVSSDILSAGLTVQSRQPRKLLEKYGRSKCNIKMLLRIA